MLCTTAKLEMQMLMLSRAKEFQAADHGLTNEDALKIARLDLRQECLDETLQMKWRYLSVLNQMKDLEQGITDMQREAERRSEDF